MNGIGQPVQLTKSKRWWQLHKRAVVIPGTWVAVNISHDHTGTRIELVDQLAFLRQNTTI